GLSPIEAGAAYIPVTVCVGAATGVATKLLPRTGPRPIIMAGALTGAAGVFWLSRIPVHGSYVADVLPGLGVIAVGLGAIFVGAQTAGRGGARADKAGLAAALGSASGQLGSALGLAIFPAIATSHTQHLVGSHVARTAALTSGFHYALVACSIFLVAAGAIASRVSNSRPQMPTAETPAEPAVLACAA